MSNFSFLEIDFKELYLDCIEAEENVYKKPRTSCFYSRRALEIAVNILFDVEGLQRPSKEINGIIRIEKNLAALTKSYLFKEVIDNKEELEKLNLIRLSGNVAVHKNDEVTSDLSLTSLEILYDFTSWMSYCYGSLKDEKEFNRNLLLKSNLEKEEELSKMIENLEKTNAEMLEKLEYLQVKKEDKKIKEFTVKNISEAKTRKLYIDILLREAGWDISKPDCKEFKVSGMPNKSEEGYADYVLWGDNGKPLAVVEAKKTLINPEQGKHQVTLYAECLEKEWKQYPVRFYTNGFETYIWEKDEIPRRVYGFYRKEELETLIIRRTQALDIEKTRNLINPYIAGRPYQTRAVTKVIENFYDKYRRSLLVMATGSGKTRTAISIVDALIRANKVKRVLFLADRTALVKQAKNNFSNLIGSDHTLENLIDVKGNSSARIVFSTYQTMINEIDKLREDETRQFGIGYFDLIIVDESHRSLYKKYGTIFEYFDSMLLGLTATPKTDIDKNTYSIFNLENGEPTDSYNLFDAKAEKFLVLPEVLEVDLKFPEQGVKYSELSDDDKEEYELKFADDEGNIPEKIDGSALNRWLFNRNTVEQVIKTLMTKGHKIQGGDKLGKTIVFAKNDRHAEFFVTVFNEMFPNLGGEFCLKISNKVNYAQDLIDKFSNPKRMPQIAVSIDMLDTGIDIPEVLNLVFFKKIRSKSKFWQMIGRGTRLCPDIFGPGCDKDNFYIFDFCKNFTYFEYVPKELQSKITESLTQKIFNSRVEITHFLQDLKYQEIEGYKELWEDLIDIVHMDIQNVNVDSAFARKERRYIEKYRDVEELKLLNETKISEVKNHLSHVVTSQDSDESTRRFDLIILSLQLSILKTNKPQTINIKMLNKIGKGLEKLTHLSKVGEKKKTIKLLNEDRFWDEVTVINLENIRVDLRDIIKYLIDNAEVQETIYSNFSDKIINMEIKDINFGKIHYLSQKEHLRKLMDKNADKISIKKLRNNITLDPKDIKELNTILFGDGIITIEEITENCKNELNNYLGIFLRTIVGLEQDAVQQKFSKLIAGNGFTSVQLEFIDYIIKHYTENGVFYKNLLSDPSIERLYGKSFFDAFPDPTQYNSILGIIEEINKTASFNIN